MDWQELEVFQTLAHELHFGRTAERLHLSRARVSQVVQTLERRIGAPLFDRTSRRVALTPIGRQLLEDLTPHQFGIMQAFARAADAARGISGTLTVGFSSPMAGERVMGIAAMFRTAHPDCEVAIREVPLTDRYSSLRGGELDLALVEFPVCEPDLVTGPAIFCDPRVLAVSSAHPLAGRGTVRAEDLSGETIHVIAGLPGYFLDDLIPAHTSCRRPIQTTTSWQELLTLVAAGQGVTVCAEQGARYYPRPTLVYLPFTDAPPLTYGLVWPVTAATAMVRAFTQAAIELSAGIATPRPVPDHPVAE
ncbi:LysR family transcriptional regulator [Nocardia mangyaensis]|uniref:LysR family transcriptional regulator n=1 Tax=Nocardia mangyaensis TaxID=2213200 RepID=A0A1J0VZ56_9NOCA|nr:LysR family transcriptional regulator [Nocardia mangyaensis]APE37273.1 LysR family transcriptional regulator [Nocardia mangyaensis]